MQTIYLDISNKGVIPCIQAKQSEVGRKFLAVITDNGVPYNIPENSLLSVWYEGDTDVGNYSSIAEKSAFVVDGNRVVVELVAQMLFKPGKGELCLSITHGDVGETNTWNIPYEVEYKPGASSAVPTEYYTALTEAGALAAEQVGYAREQAQLAKESAQEASNAVLGYVKSSDLDALLLAYEEKKTPVGYTFHWSPVEGGKVDLSTPEKVAAHFGFGVWEQIKDRFLLSSGDTFNVGESDGSATHTITESEMPSHTHQQNLRAFGASGWAEYTTNTYGIWFDYSNRTGAANYVAANSTQPSAVVSAFCNTHSTGSNSPMNIMPPYLTVYTWKRIA